MNYSIHGILNVKSEVPLSEYSYFESDESLNKENITIKRESVSMPADSRDLGTQKIGIEGRTLVCDYKFRNSKISLNFEEGKIKFTESYRKHGSLYEIVRSMIHTKIIEKGYGIINGSCVSINGVGVALCGFHKAGKSSLILNLPAESFFSDSYLIVDENGNAYSYPSKIGVPPNRKVRNADFSLRQKFKLFVYRLLSKSPKLESLRERILGDRIKVRITPEELKMKIGEKCRVGNIFVIGIGERGTSKVKLSPDKLIEQHIVGSLGFYHHHLLTLYSNLFLNPFKILDKNKQIIKNFLDNVETWEIKRTSVDGILRELEEKI